jgi:1-acyl-sn-glycerol-3-phosphate acyltransferase
MAEVSFGPPIAPKPGESAGELMEKVSVWIEQEMRRIDPEAYPADERPPDPAQQEAAQREILEVQAAAARAAQGGVADEN